MKIINHTHYKTLHLRAFVTRVARLEEISPAKLKLLTVTFNYGRAGEWRRQQGFGGTTSGRAVVGGTRMTIYVQKSGVDRIDLAHTLAHEFAHIRGLEHAQMRGRTAYYRINNWRELYAWAEQLPLEVQQPRQSKKRDAQMERYARTLAAIKRWEAKAKRAATALKTYRQKQRYYERVLTAAGKLEKAS
jgi:hypothetical protein